MPSGLTSAGLTSAGLDERVAQVVMDGLLWNPERPPDPDCGQLAGVDQAVHRHPGDPHHVSNLGHREETHLGQRLVAETLLADSIAWRVATQPLRCAHVCTRPSARADAGFPSGGRSARVLLRVAVVGAVGKRLSRVANVTRRVE